MRSARALLVKRPMILRADGLALVLSTVLVACSSNPSDEGPAPGAGDPSPAPSDTTAPANAPPAAALDHGAPSTTYPAFAPTMPKLVDHGGGVLKTPVIVTITFPGETNGATFEKLADEIGATPYWKTVVGEYGVGNATSGSTNHVHASEPLTIASGGDPEAALEDYVRAALSDTAKSHWPEPTANAIYTLFISGPIAQSLCDEGMGGSHASVDVKGKRVPYALVLTCTGDPSMTPLDGATVSASHEWAEAATDPFPDAAPAWAGLTDADLGWELLVQGQDENGDMCEFDQDSYGNYGAPELAPVVQRQWSNVSAAAGHTPCVPAPPQPYFSAALLETASVEARITRPEFPWQKATRGVAIPVGQSKQIPIGFISDGATEAFKLQAFEMDPFSDGAGPPDQTLTLSLDKDSGKNGEKAYLSVKVDKTSPNGNVHLVVIEATLGNERHTMPLIITD